MQGNVETLKGAGENNRVQASRRWAVGEEARNKTNREDRRAWNGEDDAERRDVYTTDCVSVRRGTQALNWGKLNVRQETDVPPAPGEQSSKVETRQDGKQQLCPKARRSRPPE